MLHVRTFNSAKELLDHLEGRPAPCRTTSAPNTAAGLVSPKDRAEAETNQGPIQTSGYAQTVHNEKTTGPFPPAAFGLSNAQWNGVAATPAPTVKTTEAPSSTPKRPTSLSTVVTVETPQKPKTKARNLGIGQAIRLQSGNTVYRLGPENYLVLTPYNVTLHYSAETLSDYEGELLPLGSKIVIRV